MKVKQKKTECLKKVCGTRIRHFSGLLRQNRIDAVVIRNSINVFYFTGIQTSNGLLVVYSDGRSVFLTDFRYQEVAERILPSTTEFAVFQTNAMKKVQTAQLFSKMSFIGCEDNLALNEFEQFNEAAGEGTQWTPISDLIAELRAVKSKEELKKIRLATALNDTVFLETINSELQGRTEAEIRALIRIKMIAEGAEEAFETIVASGVNASQCHHTAGESICGEKGSALLIDMGARLEHYCSDMTRCISFGKPSVSYRRIYDLVLKANETAIDKIAPGKTCGEIDAIARKMIAKAGYEKAFGHSLGHAVGLEVHESPGLRAGDATVLRPGMVLTIEPGVYLPGKFGVRIEDLILVTKTGCEILTQTPKELLII